MSDIDADLRALAKQLPHDKPDAERREAVRSSLLVAATERTPASTRKRWLFVGGGFAAGALAAAAIAIVLGGVSPRESTAPVRAAHARIEAPTTAQLEHTVTATATGTDEVVRVRAGVVKVAVPTALRRGDRVRLQTADAEVEATGSYEASVVDDRLERLTVADGTARITARIDGQQQQVFLSAGQTWRPKIATAEVELSPPPKVEAPPPVAAPPPVEAKVEAPVEAPKQEPKTVKAHVPGKVATIERPAETATTQPADPATERLPAVTELEITPTKQPSTTEQHFKAGWALLRAGKAREAAVELGAAADGNDPLAIDARYFQAVALVRAGDPAAAERVLVGFLDRAPTSLRRGRAAVMLGKLLRDRGAVDTARKWFESAATDADPAIAAAARAHLDSLR